MLRALSLVFCFLIAGNALAAGSLLVSYPGDDLESRRTAREKFPDEALEREYVELEERVRRMTEQKFAMLTKANARVEICRPSVLGEAVSLNTVEIEPPVTFDLGGVAVVDVLRASGGNNVVLYLVIQDGHVPLKRGMERSIAPRQEWERRAAKQLRDWLDRQEAAMR